MRFMLIVKADERSERGEMPTEAELTEMGAFNERMAKAGVMLSGEGLHSSASGTRVIFSDGTPALQKGPFAATTELISGFWLIEAASHDEAVHWAKQVPFRSGIVEVRRVAEAEDFGEAYTDEVRAQEDRVRAELASNQ